MAFAAAQEYISVQYQWVLSEFIEWKIAETSTCHSFPKFLAWKLRLKNMNMDNDKKVLTVFSFYRSEILTNGNIMASIQICLNCWGVIFGAKI